MATAQNENRPKAVRFGCGHAGAVFTPELVSMEREADEILKELPDIAELARKFISKILWKEEPTDIDRKFMVSMMMADPRSSGVATNLSMIPNNDWRIRIEWLF